MTRNTEPNGLNNLLKGVLLLIGCHALACLLIFVVGFVIGSIIGGYSVLVIWFGGALGLCLWQLLYVIPLTIWLKRRGKIDMMNGVIIGAVLTALVSGACYVGFFVR